MKRRWIAGLLAGALIAGACGGGGDEAGDELPDEQSAAEETTTTTTEAAPASSTAEAPVVASTTTTVPSTEVVESVTIVGEPEVVFDWSEDACEAEHIPDIAARAIRNADGLVQLYVSHYVTYRMIGDDLNTVATDCTVTHRSNFDSDPSLYDEAGWIAAPYTEDGETVHAVIHNEYRGFVFSPNDQCPNGNYLSCIDVTLTMAISEDGGETFDHIADPPNHLFASLPDVYNAEGEPSGLWQTSNLVVPGDGYHYLLTNINAYDRPDDVRQWTCLLRTPDLDDPRAWRFWDGSGFDGVFVDPYREPADPDDEICAPISRQQIGAEIMETVVLDEASGRYVALGMASSSSFSAPWGIYASFSDDLITWSERSLVLELPMSPTVENPDTDLRFAYPAIIDPDSASLNFDTTDGQAYLYIARLNAGGGSLDRDLLRYPIEIVGAPQQAPSWGFDTAGDAEGWTATWDLAGFDVENGVLATSSIGDDPYTESAEIRVTGRSFPTLSITMRVDDDNVERLGQVFFRTENDPTWSEAQSVTFPVDADGEWHTYDIDMSQAEGWAGTVIQLRFDPVDRGGLDLAIDQISFG